MVTGLLAGVVLVVPRAAVGSRPGLGILITVVVTVTVVQEVFTSSSPVVAPTRLPLHPHWSAHLLADKCVRPVQAFARPTCRTSQRRPRWPGRSCWLLEEGDDAQEDGPDILHGVPLQQGSSRPGGRGLGAGEPRCTRPSSRRCWGATSGSGTESLAGSKCSQQGTLNNRPVVDVGGPENGHLPVVQVALVHQGHRTPSTGSSCSPWSSATAPLRVGTRGRARRGRAGNRGVGVGPAAGSPGPKRSAGSAAAARPALPRSIWLSTQNHKVC